MHFSIFFLISACVKGPLWKEVHFFHSKRCFFFKRKKLNSINFIVDKASFRMKFWKFLNFVELFIFSLLWKGTFFCFFFLIFFIAIHACILRLFHILHHYWWFSWTPFPPLKLTPPKYKAPRALYLGAKPRPPGGLYIWGGLYNFNGP